MYSQDGMVYGTEPNDFLVDVLMQEKEHFPARPIPCTLIGSPVQDRVNVYAVEAESLARLAALHKVNPSHATPPSSHFHLVAGPRTSL